MRDGCRSDQASSRRRRLQHDDSHHAQPAQAARLRAGRRCQRRIVRARQIARARLLPGHSDWNMEPMTGFALLQEMRSDPSLAEIPFIMVTTESKTENLIAAKRAGVSNYIVKPFDAQTLKTKIDAVFGEQQIPAPAA